MTHRSPAKNVDLLLKVMQALRAPDGCPWDAEQTPESLTPYIIEEACELVDAIEDGSLDLIRDELGDLLLQVVFQAQIFSERGQFDFDDVARSITEKLIRRHPHVFSKEQGVAERSQLDKQWDDIKRSEATYIKSCLADHLPSKLPALQYTQKLISKALKAGVRSESLGTRPDLDKLSKLDASKSSTKMTEETVGQFLLHIVLHAQAAGIDAETSLRKTAKKVLLELDNKA